MVFFKKMAVRKKKTVIKFFDVVNEKEGASTPSYHLLLFQELTKFFHSTSTVANGILDIITQFGKGQFITFWYEDWIVTKTSSTSLLFDDFTFHNSFEKMFFTIHD